MPTFQKWLLDQRSPDCEYSEFAIKAFNDVSWDGRKKSLKDKIYRRGDEDEMRLFLEIEKAYRSAHNSEFIARQLEKEDPLRKPSPPKRQDAAIPTVAKVKVLIKKKLAPKIHHEVVE